jgi:hypothetical protein
MINEFWGLAAFLLFPPESLSAPISTHFVSASVTFWGATSYRFDYVSQRACFEPLRLMQELYGAHLAPQFWSFAK